jgi:hypothetical protein
MRGLGMAMVLAVRLVGMALRPQIMLVCAVMA